MYSNKKKSIDYGSRKSYSDKKSLISSNKAKQGSRDSITNFYSNNRNSEVQRASTQHKFDTPSKAILKTSESPLKSKRTLNKNQIID